MAVVKAKIGTELKAKNGTALKARYATAPPMARPAEKLADSLDALHRLQSDGRVAIRSSDLSRTDRPRLIDAGFLREIIRGWYISTRPDEEAGESTAWFASFWGFMSQYLDERLGNEWV